MTHDTAAATRQLHLVELDADGQQRGPTIRWPQDWPSAAATIDLSAATLPQAVEAWRDWVTGADRNLLVDIATSGNAPDMIVLISGRAWLASFGVTPDGQDGQVGQNAAPAGSRGPGERPARSGELCTCGRPAVTVYETEKFGDVGYCGIPDGGA